LASSIKKREQKAVSSLEFLLDVIIIIIVFIFFNNISVAAPSPRIFHRGRRKRRVDYGLGGLKTHGRAHLVLALLWVGESLAHLLMRLTNESFVGATHRYKSPDALDKNILLFAPMRSSPGGLGNRGGYMP
jgi:hypothetical protein